MKNQRENRYATLSLFSVVLTVFLASISHAYEFGHHAFIAGSVILVLFTLLNIWFRRTGSRGALLAYGFLNVFIIIGFGIINGLWNHGFKLFLYFLHGESLPPMFAQMFSDQYVGSILYECVGTLSFVASMLLAYYGYKLLQVRREIEYTSEQRTRGDQHV